MDGGTAQLFTEDDLEILPPENGNLALASTCLCCCRNRPPSAMDEDGCGICEECLAQ